MARVVVLSVIMILSISAFGQITGGSISGNFQADFQYYQDDDKLGINDSSLAGRRTGLNAFSNLLYSSNNLEAGIRYEQFTPPLTGYDSRYEGVGIANRYLRFHDQEWDITVGNYYEQFGNGLIFRTYNDWSLGYDNAMDGIRLKYRPFKGVYLKMLAGVQRLYWDSWDKEDDRGLVSGIDAEISLNETFMRLSDKRTNVILGGSFVSKNQKDNHPLYKMPRNVAAFAGRFNLSRNNFMLIGEYAYKINDPSSDNGMIYKPGEAIFLQGSYALKGFAFSLGVKRLDNMSFRSDPNARINDLMINYLPALNKQHIYILPATYPYATQANGEVGITASLGYKIDKEHFLGGPYGTDIAIYFTRVTDIERIPLDSLTRIGQSGTLGYKTEYFVEGEKFFEDLTLEVNRRLARNLRLTLLYSRIYYNIAVIEGHSGEENVISNNIVGDLTWRFKSRQALRFEAQHLSTEQDKGNWLSGTLEYTYRGFFASLQDTWNYGNKSEKQRLHYIIVSTGFTKNATRFAASYGRQKEGIVCVGGVCRFLPAISGFSMTITTTF